MEVSSHALHFQRRIFGMHYDVAVFTNLSRDQSRLSRHHGRLFLRETAALRGRGRASLRGVCGRECRRSIRPHPVIGLPGTLSG